MKKARSCLTVRQLRAILLPIEEVYEVVETIGTYGFVDALLHDNKLRLLISVNPDEFVAESALYIIVHSNSSHL